MRQGVSFNLINASSVPDVLDQVSNSLKELDPAVEVDLDSSEDVGDGIYEVVLNVETMKPIDFDDLRDALEVIEGVYDITTKDAGNNNFKHFAF